MSIDFVSGLVLAVVAFAVVVFLIKEAFGERRSGPKKSRQYFAGMSAKLWGREAKPVNEHLIGMAGNVIAHSQDSERPMEIRLGPERWSARSDSTEAPKLPVGASVEVVAVDDLVLVVRAAGSDATQ